MSATDQGEACDVGRRDATLTSAAYHRLLDDILWGRLEAGHRLRLQKLKAKYGMGSTPLREALSRLAESGFVQREENRGFSVCPMTLEEFDELVKTRCWLEDIALRDSIEHGDEEWESRVVLALHWLTRAQRHESDPMQTRPDWEDLHRKFHLALLSACTSKILIEFCDQLLRRTLRYRNLSGTQEYREDQEKSEHRAICEAALERDADKAVKRLREHYTNAQKVVAASGRVPQRAKTPEND